MVSPNRKEVNDKPEAGTMRISSFTISGGIFGGTHKLTFPEPPPSGSEASLLILAGKNGSGKTTILRMISGILDLNFDIFRTTPFSSAILELSDGSSVSVSITGNAEYPLRVGYKDIDVQLYNARINPRYTEDSLAKIAKMREIALPILHQISFEFIDIHRSLALKTPDENQSTDIISAQDRIIYEAHVSERALRNRAPPSLSTRVRAFMRDAQINYRKFFSAEDLELLPRILERFQLERAVSNKAELLARITAVRERFPIMRRFALQTDDADLKALNDLLIGSHGSNARSLALIEAYVEMQESRHKARELIARRLLEFEAIMDEFLSGKIVRIDARSGLSISTPLGPLEEVNLSSGEYHFLYMMVAALLCERTGSIIAIDEPELSLHVSWQRQLLGALKRCAAGASPLFLLATHSAAIAAEHMDHVYALSRVE